jgi:hypothetical protein
VFTLAKRFDDEGEVEEPEEEDIEFLEAGENSAEAFESPEEPLDFVALFCRERSYSQGSMRLDFGGTTGIMPRLNTSCLVSSPS